MAELTYSVSAVGVRASEAKAPFKRIVALDVVRGFAMLLMLISHSSWWLDDLDYGVAYGWDNMIVPQIHFPESIPGFVLQLATPAFFLLSGFSIALFAASRRRRGWQEWQITRFLMIRGLLLIALDLTVMNLQPNAPYYGRHVSVLTGIGICVCLMAWLRRLDRGKLIGLTLLVLLGTQLYYHNLSAAGEWPRQESLVRAVLLTPSVEDLTWKTQFPALPWLPVVALGFLAASRVIEGAVSLGKLALRLGLGCLIVFAGAMLASSIGRLYPAQALILTKHPPDLAYLSLYTGLAFLLIALQNRLEFTHTRPFMKIVIVLGQTALFFYVLHIRLIELVSPMVAPLPLPPLLRSLLIVLAVLPVMVLSCRLYRVYKRQHSTSVLQYL